MHGDTSSATSFSQIRIINIHVFILSRLHFTQASSRFSTLQIRLSSSRVSTSLLHFPLFKHLNPFDLHFPPIIRDFEPLNRFVLRFITVIEFRRISFDSFLDLVFLIIPLRLYSSEGASRSPHRAFCHFSESLVHQLVIRAQVLPHFES
ncbi:hypothetical protein LR48_Vigan09g202200 [Vigna angularis]|uniref:Uncharacterized protein n=1 Tax=Phaseolus angularis TaxID=3914 RepID=A0A0L9VED5_PHAAN|nr:hypothetical protein LR48_Vigan09g202200 [Vigna angularis]